jgi:hypothetical protein
MDPIPSEIALTTEHKRLTRLKQAIEKKELELERKIVQEPAADAVQPDVYTFEPKVMQCTIRWDMFALNPQVEIDEYKGEKAREFEYHCRRQLIVENFLGSNPNQNAFENELKKKVEKKLEDWMNDVRKKYEKVN